MDPNISSQSTPVVPPTSAPQSNSTSEKKAFSVKTFIASREGWVVGAALLVSSYMGYLYAIMMIVSYYGGGYVADWLKKRGNINQKLVKVIAWLNVISWLFSFSFFSFGLFTSKFTDNLAFNDPVHEKTYKRLAKISYILSIVVAIGIWFFSISIKNMQKFGHS